MVSFVSNGVVFVLVTVQEENWCCCDGCDGWIGRCRLEGMEELLGL